ncbi:MFS transporter [Paenibacillus selenitireducens]|uniref:MFS transporter n=1 Tax=Paenibacillus selenitireducens TaxID=1324314 RepID=UPI001E5202EF|nr:MFS transporter [Paenibacillus selenitireducens]
MEKPKAISLHQLFSPFVMELLVILFLVEFVKGALLVTILPIYMGTVLGLSAFAIGWAFSLQYIGDNLFRSPLGWIIERVGYRICMLMGLIVTFVAVGIIAITSQLYFIILACLLLGIGTSPLWPCVVTGATQVAGQEKQGTVLSVVYVAWLSGTGVGPVVINFFVKHSYAPAFRFLLLCMALVTIVALFLPGRKQTEELHRSEKEDSAETKLSMGNLSQKIKATLHEVRKNLHVSWWFYVALFLQNFSIGLLTPVITLYARTVIGLNPTQYSILLIIGGGITVVALIPMGRWVDKMGTKWFLHIGFGLTAATLFVFATTRSMLFIYILVCMLGVGYALIIPAWNAFIASVIPKSERGAIWGFFLTLEGSGMVVGPIVSGRLWDMIGSHAPFYGSALGLLALFCIHWYISSRPRVTAAS